MARELGLPFFVIYQRPRDYPHCYVVRRWVTLTPDAGGTSGRPDPQPLAIAATLEQARAAVPDYCTNIGRMDFDDPVICEVGG
jgi:hypothetical protein